MEEFEVVKKLEYLVAFQNECLNRGDFENFDRSENAIKKLEEILIDPKRREAILENREFKNMLESLQTVSSF